MVGGVECTEIISSSIALSASMIYALAVSCGRIWLICRNEEKLRGTMTDEQKELFVQYSDCVQEHDTITDCLIFQNSFKLGARMMLEVMEE